MGDMEKATFFCDKMERFYSTNDQTQALIALKSSISEAMRNLSPYKRDKAWNMIISSWSNVLIELPDCYQCNVVIAESLINLNQPKDSFAFIETAIQVNPNDPSAHCLDCLANIRIGEFEKADAIIQKSISPIEGISFRADLLKLRNAIEKSLQFSKVNRHADVINVLSQTIKSINCNNIAQIWYLRAKAYSMNGNKVKAREDYKRVLVIDASDAHVCIEMILSIIQSLHYLVICIFDNLLFGRWRL